MGFDLYGISPISEKGKYFQNNIWNWARLWDFTCLVGHDFLTENDKKAGYSNDFREITNEISQELAKRLFQAVENKQQYNAWIDGSKGPCELIQEELISSIRNSIPETIHPQESIFPFDWDNVKRFAEFCRESGGFIIC
jgi:hypothetical protein